MQFELRNPMVSFILLCNVLNMLKCVFELYKHYPMISLIRIKNEMLYKATIFYISG